MQNDVGGFDEAEGFHGEQFGIAGTGADESHVAGDGARGFPARPRQLARGAEGGVADLALRELVEQQAALFAARMRGENFAAQFAELRKPGAEILGKLFVDLAAQALRDGGAFAGRGDGDLQVAAADYGAEEEVAVGNVVDAVAGNAARDGFAIDGRIDFGHVGSGDDDEVAVEIGGSELALDPFELAFGGELADFRAGLGRNDAELHAGLEQAADLFERNRSRAHQQGGAASSFRKIGSKFIKSGSSSFRR